MNKPRRNHLALGVTILFFSFLITACSGTTPQAAEVPGLDLAGSSWQLETVNNVAASAEQPAALYFGNQSGLVGFTGCNILTGGFQLSGSQISIPVNVVTPFTCSDELKLQEEALVQTLTEASSAKLEGDKLTLSNPDGSLSASFIQTPPAGISGTSWRLNAFNDGQGAFVNVIQGTEITAQFGNDGTLSGSAGCNSYSATYSTDGGSISIGAAASTMMACAEPAGIMEQETQYLTALPSASQYLNLGAVLYLSNAENDPVALYIFAQP